MPATRVQKRKLALSEAGDQWERAKLEIARQQALLDEAAPILLAHFEKTGAASYKNRIAWKMTGGSTVLDTDAVRAFLGPRVEEFSKTTKRSRSLMLLGRE